MVIKLSLAPNNSKLIKPYIAIIYNDITPLNDDDNDILASQYLNPNITNGKIHKLVIVYNRIDFLAKKEPGNIFQLRSGVRKFFDKSYANNWIDKFKLGMMSIYIDNLEMPIIE